MSDALLRAFPTSLRGAVSNVVAELPPPASEPAGSFNVRVDNEVVEIPQRIYSPEPPDSASSAWPRVEQSIYACLYTRHQDGYTRQRHIRSIVGLDESWVVPFVVQLIGEYVVEIVMDIQHGLAGLEMDGSPHRGQYAAFAGANPTYMALTAARVVSYWNCYYRHDYPKLSDYPGYQLISALEPLPTKPA